MREMTQDKKVVIAGAGLTGMMSALKLTESMPGSDIVMFDKSPATGGMYNSIDCGDGKIFDHGMHVIYESCNPDVDELYFKVMPPTDWHIYENNEKDIAGVFFRGKLQTFSHYVDLRSFSEKEKERFVGGLFINLEKPLIDKPSTAIDFLKNQFGHEIVEHVHKPLLKSLYSIEPETLDIFAIKATSLERVVLFHSATMLDLMKADAIRARIAFPDQQNLPPYRRNSQRALYPKQFGMRHFIQRLQEQLVSSGVQIFTNTSMSDIVVGTSGIEEVSLLSSDGNQQKVPVNKLIWTVGWPALATALKINISDLKFQKGPKIVYANLIFNKPPKMGDLYYFYCYDTGFSSFRVTNYSNYCPAAADGGSYPMCVELWPSRVGLAAENLSADECTRIALEELKKFGVIDKTHGVIYSENKNMASEFPLPTVENRRGLQEIRRRVKENNISNFVVAGIMAEDGLFFIPDILNDAFEKLKTFDCGGEK